MGRAPPYRSWATNPGRPDSGPAPGYRAGMTCPSSPAAPVEVVDFEGLEIRWDRRVRRPRAWTAQQSRLAADVSASCPSGPILELCCGPGEIGLLAAGLTGRDLVQVDHDPVAASYARRNAAAAGVRSDIRGQRLAAALAPGEVFPLAIADPPWLPTDNGVPEGLDGLDGSDALVVCLDAALRHLSPSGHLVFQVALPQHVDRLAERLVEPPPGPGGTAAAVDGFAVLDVVDCRPGGLLVHAGPATGGGPR